MITPGELILDEGAHSLNPGRRTLTLVVRNAADRPIQVGSHYHFAETNSALDFDRAAARRPDGQGHDGCESHETPGVGRMPVAAAQAVAVVRMGTGSPEGGQRAGGRAFEDGVDFHGVFRGGWRFKRSAGAQ